MKNKKAAFEMSIGTMVVIVLAITMLILGLTLIRNIFRGATESVSVLDENTRKAISSLFTDETEDIVIQLGAENTAKIRPGSGIFKVAVGARTPDGSEAGSRDRLKFKLSLQPATGRNCMSVIGEAQTKALFLTPIDTEQSFFQFEGDQVFADVEIEVPKGTPTCSQRVLIDVIDSETGRSSGSFFGVEILRRYF